MRQNFYKELYFKSPYPSFDGAQCIGFEKFICHQNPPSPQRGEGIFGLSKCACTLKALSR